MKWSKWHPNSWCFVSRLTEHIAHYNIISSCTRIRSVFVALLFEKDSPLISLISYYYNQTVIYICFTLHNVVEIRPTIYCMHEQWYWWRIMYEIQLYGHGALVSHAAWMLFQSRTLRPRQNGRHFADDISTCIFFNTMIILGWHFHWNLFNRVQ